MQNNAPNARIAQNRDNAVSDTLDHADVSLDSVLAGWLGQTTDCVKILGMTGTLDFMNCNGMRAMEIDDFSMVAGKPWWELWPLEERERVHKAFDAANCGKENQFEAMCPTARGKLKRWCVKLSPMLARDGRVAGVLCTSKDISKTPM